MKKIYFAHSADYPDFIEKLYKPLKTISGFEFIFPYEKEGDLKPSKEIIKNCNLFIADVSSQKLGTGIEIGWADAFNVPILFIYKEGAKLSRSLNIVSRNFVEYDIIENKLADIKKTINILAN